MFCGKYITSVPEGYFEHLDELRGQSRSSAAPASSQAGSGGPLLLGNAAKTNGSGGLRSPADREDIR